MSHSGEMLLSTHVHVCTHHCQAWPWRHHDLEIPPGVVELLANGVLQQGTGAEPSHHVDVAKVMEVRCGQLRSHLFKCVGTIRVLGNT